MTSVNSSCTRQSRNFRNRSFWRLKIVTNLCARLNVPLSALIMQQLTLNSRINGLCLRAWGRLQCPTWSPKRMKLPLKTALVCLSSLLAKADDGEGMFDDGPLAVDPSVLTVTGLSPEDWKSIRKKLWTRQLRSWSWFALGDQLFLSQKRNSNYVTCLTRWPVTHLHLPNSLLLR